MGVGTGRSAVAIAFPGQGAQAPGLGEGWVETPHWAIVERAEKAAGVDLAPLLLDATPEDLKRTRAAQLSVFLTSLLAWDAVQSAHSELAVGAFCGHSLGQVTALVASGAIDFDDGVRFAVARADATQACADAGNHAMAALMGATYDQAADLCAATGDCWVANDNGGGQVVIAGTSDGIERAAAASKDAGIKRVIPLNVGGAFHTPLMADAAAALAPLLAELPWQTVATPIACNTDGALVTDGTEWPQRLSTHLTQPVRWHGVLETLAANGVTHLVEVGPGSTLAGLVKRSGLALDTTNVASAADAAGLTIGENA
jgi:[acyl-carrier-protein] S-malonyltransferase